MDDTIQRQRLVQAVDDAQRRHDDKREKEKNTRIPAGTKIADSDGKIYIVSASGVFKRQNPKGISKRERMKMCRDARKSAQQGRADE